MLSDLVKVRDKVRDKVEYVLKTFPSSRDSDKKLWMFYMSEFHNLPRILRSSRDPYFSFSNLLLDESTPTMESIRRVRQKFQQDGLYLGSKRLVKLEEEKRVRDWSRS